MAAADADVRWQTVDGRVVRGHGVASGRADDPRFPGGTIRMQLPHFAARGLDLAAFHPGTVNVSIAPQAYHVVRPRITLRDVRWHATQPAEDFSFFDVRVHRASAPDSELFDGLVYYPHPDTKPEHFQRPDVLELLLPRLDSLRYDEPLTLRLRADQLAIASTGESVLDGPAVDGSDRTA
jgi:hypothetical protein